MRLARAALVASALSCASEARAGAWVPEAGSGYAKLWLKYLPGFWFTDGRGVRHDYGSYHEVFVSAYLEVGLVPGLALWAHAPLAQVFGLEDTRARVTQWHATVGDPTIGLRLQVIRARGAAFALEAFVRAPVGPGGPVQTVYDRAGTAVGELRIANGAADVGAQLSMGYARRAWYVGGSFGAIARSNGFDPAGTFTAEGGGRLARGRVGLRGRVTGYLSLPLGSAPRHESPSGMGNGTRYWGFAVESDLRVSARWDLGITLEGGIVGLLRQTGGPVVSLYAATSF